MSSDVQERLRLVNQHIQEPMCVRARETIVTESHSAMPAVFDTASDLALPVLLFPVLLVLLVIGPGLFIWLINPWGVIYAVIFYNIPFIALGAAVFLNPDSRGLWWLWVFQMITAYFGVLLTCPTEF